MGTLTILDDKGDTKLTWEPNDPDSVKEAKKRFDDLKKQGYSAFAVETETKEVQGRRIDKFESDMGEVLMVPQRRGG